MALISCYAAMILTNWGIPNGSDMNNSLTCANCKRADDVSMWLKIISQWVLLLLYFKVLHVAYTENH